MLLKFLYIYYGILIPGWRTFKAVANGHRDLINIWLKYWVIFAMLQVLGYFTDIIFDGSLLYTLIKLILTVILWLSCPDSTRMIYNLIDKPVLQNLKMRLDNQGMSLGQQLSRSFWSADREENPEDEIPEPRVNAELLSRELSILMADIAGGDTSNRESMPRQRNLRNRQAMRSPRYRVHYSEDEQSDSM